MMLHFSPCILLCILFPFIFGFVPSCDQNDLFVPHADLGESSYYAALSALEVPYTYYPSFVPTDYHTKGYKSVALSHMLFAVDIVRRVYQNDQIVSWNVSTLNDCVDWSKASTDASSCRSRRPCCLDTPTPAHKYYFGLHNYDVGRQMVLDQGLPLKTLNEYGGIGFNITEKSKWFNTQTFLAPVLCYDNRTSVYWEPIPAGVDAFETDDCSQVAVYLNSSVQEHTFHVQDDEDWVWFCGNAGENYTITVTGIANQSSPTFEVFQGDDKVSIGTGSSSFSWTSSSSGVFMVKVWSSSTFTDPTQTNYTLSVSGNSHNLCNVSQVIVPPVNPFPPSPGPMQNCSYPVCTRTTPGLQSRTFNSNRYGFTISVENDTLWYIIQLLKDGQPTSLSYRITLDSFQEYDSTGYYPYCQPLGGTVVDEIIEESPDGAPGPKNINLTVTLSNCATFKLANYLYDQASLLNYAGESYEIASNTFKFSIEISNWPLQQPGNSLKQTSLTESTIKPIYQSVKYDENLNVQKVVIVDQFNATWTFRYLDDGIVDGQIAPVGRRSIAKALNANGTVALTELRFPSFNSTIFYDPDFTVLFQGEKGSETENEEEQEEEVADLTDGKLNSAEVAGIAIAGAVFFVIVAVVVGVILMKRRRNLRRKQHLEKMNVSHPESDNPKDSQP